MQLNELLHGIPCSKPVARKIKTMFLFLVCNSDNDQIIYICNFPTVFSLAYKLMLGLEVRVQCILCC